MLSVLTQDGFKWPTAPLLDEALLVFAAELVATAEPAPCVALVDVCVAPVDPIGVGGREVVGNVLGFVAKSAHGVRT